MPENKEAVEVYIVTRGQMITAGMSGQIIDVSIPAIKIVMDLWEVQDQKTCLSKVRAAFHALKPEQKEGDS